VRLHVCAVGRKSADWLDVGFNDYARRMPGAARLSLHTVAHAKPGQPIERARADEGRRLRGVLPKRAQTVALDRSGTALSSEAVAERAREWNRTGAAVAFVIGGADGLEPELLDEADERWSLSSLTLPHGLVRVIIAEQLYRALTILHNQPYHR